MPDPFEQSAEYYDLIYGRKSYREEAESVRSLLIRLHPSATNLLEVGCGTGGHIVYLRSWYTVEGLDASPTMLAVARRKLRDIALHEGDMRHFALGKKFDVVTCLFSVIGYVRSVAELDTAVATMARHLRPEGVLIVEPWWTANQWQTPGAVVGSLVVDQPELKIARFVVSETRGRFAVTPMHHLVARPSGVTHFIETHELLLATADEYAQAFARAGLKDVTFAADVLPRGAWIGRAPT
jgi:ubiquinone/menaquinone biosynthesis C-methylase UbiE